MPFFPQPEQWRAFRVFFTGFLSGFTEFFQKYLPSCFFLIFTGFTGFVDVAIFFTGPNSGGRFGVLFLLDFYRVLPSFFFNFYRVFFQSLLGLRDSSTLPFFPQSEQRKAFRGFFYWVFTGFYRVFFITTGYTGFVDVLTGFLPGFTEFFTGLRLPFFLHRPEHGRAFRGPIFTGFVPGFYGVAMFYVARVTWDANCVQVPFTAS